MTHHPSTRLPRVGAHGVFFAFLALVVLGGSTTCVAAAADPPSWIEREWHDSPVEIRVATRDQLTRLADLLGEEVLHRDAITPTGAGAVVRVRVTEPQALALHAAGFETRAVEDLERAGREEAERSGRAREGLARRAPFVFPLSVYPSTVEIGQILADLASARPDLAAVYQWGTSVGGRPLWGLRITDQVTVEEAEPEVRLAANIHGDETVDTIMLLNLAHELVTNHGQPGHADLTELVDAYEIHILPQYNPDGYVAGVRSNANGYDLNRNFPEPVGQHAVRQTETVHFMTHALAHHFVISQMGHGGALVVNYPWDYTYTRAPDDAALIELSLEYSTENLPMYNGSFPQGITNGADWYVVTGSLQDWSYAVTGCIDLTLEISNVKWPSANSLGTYWNNNRQSLINLVRAARYGIHGRVTAQHDGSPLDAVVTVAGNSVPVVTDPDFGDYYKLLATGTYDLTFEAVGFEPVTVQAVETTWGIPTVVDVSLQAVGTDAPATNRGPSRIEAVAPNPFNPSTEVRFVLGVDGPVSVDVVDARGRSVRALLSAHLSVGSHTVHWDGKDDVGRPAASGVYFVVLRALDGRRTTKAVLVQ